MGRIPEENHDLDLSIYDQQKIGLIHDVCNPVVKILNDLLADEAVLTQKTHSALWNVCGAGFYNIQILLNSQIDELNGISVEIVVRTRKLGGFIISSFEEFLKATRLKEQPGIVPNASDLLADHESLIHFLHESATRCSEEFEDEISRGFLMDILQQHDKMVSMLQSYIENQPQTIECKGSYKYE